MAELNRILIVDDSTQDRAAVARILRREGAIIGGADMEVTEADSISAAREALRRTEFACVFLDHDLPDGTSLDLLMEIRSQGMATPVVVLTGQRAEEAIVQVMEAGAVDYLPKDRLHPDLVARSLQAAWRFLQVQREKQAALDELRARDRAIAAASNGIVIADPRQADCPLVYVNAAFLQMTGYAEEEVLGHNCRFLQGPDTNPDVVKKIRDAIIAEDACQEQILNYRKNGTTFWNEVTVSPVRDAQGSVTHFVGVQTDVTERQDAEDERRRAADELRQFEYLVENAADALYLLDERGHFVYVNAAACRSLGYTRQELTYLRAKDIGLQRSDAAYQALFQGLQGNVLPPFEAKHRRKDGTSFPIEATMSLVEVGDQRLLLASVRDITERRQSEQAVQEAHARTTALLESITDAFFALDADWQFTYLNDQAERLLLRNRENLLGRSLWEEFSAAVGTEFERQYRRAVQEKVTVTFEAFYLPLDLWVDVRAYPAEGGGLSVFFQDVTARKKAEAALKRSQEDLRLAVDAARLGTFYCDYPLDKIIWNDICKEHFFLSSDADVNISLFYSLLHPEDRESTRQAIERAEREQVKYDVEYRTLGPQGQTRWINAVGRFYYDAQGKPTRFDGVTIDISARKATEKELRERVERERFLANLTESAHAVTDPNLVIADAVNSLGSFLSVTSCVFDDIDMDTGDYFIRHQYRSDASVPHITGSYPLSSFGTHLVNEFLAGHTVVVSDTHTDPVCVPPETVAAYDAIGIRAHASAPVVHTARLVSFISCHSNIPRVWTPDEVSLIQTVVERTWLTVEVLRQQQALAREAQVQRTRAEREALLNRIGAAIRVAREPDQVLRTAVSELGKALGADRCYYAEYDQRADTATINLDWCRPGLSSMAGRYRMSDFTINLDPGYQAGRAQAVTDTKDDPAAQSLNLRALLRVPLASGQEMTSLAVVMTSGPRAWTSEDLTLVEAVATQTQTALEAMQIQRREHQIAQQLQDALQPALTDNVPGLSLGWYTRPALAEAEVGGDFFDVFPLDKDLHVLILGDVSGKGLSAAQQLALIRNSLRTTLYLRHDPAQAAAELNNIVTVHDLLIGFVTVWIGLYDAASGRIIYCSCGHEPALVRRAVSGDVEVLNTNGPPLGVKQNASYTEETIMLAAGDALLLYTDGLSEAGPNRRQLLGTEGLRGLLATLPADVDAQGQARALVEDVSQFSGGVFRDDVAVLLLVRR